MQPETVWIGDSECGLETKKRLILHAYDIFTFNDNSTRDGLISTDNALMTDDVSIRVNRVEGASNCIFWVGEWSQYFVDNGDKGQRSATCFWMVGRNCCNWFAHVSNNVFCEYRLIATDQAVCGLTRHVICSDDAVNTRKRERR